MLVQVLGSVWARCAALKLPDDAEPLDDDLRAWLKAVDTASPPVASDLVVAAESRRTSLAVRWLLNWATSTLTRDTPVHWNEIADLGVLLLRIVERGHGTEFTGGELAEAHGRTLIGLGHHLSAPSSSRSAYQEAARDYLGRGESMLSSLAQLGAATASWSAILEGDQEEIRAQLAAVAANNPEVAIEIEPSLNSYMSILRFIAALRSGPSDSSPALDKLHEGDTEAAAKLLERAALSSLDDVAVAARLGRAADELFDSLDEAGNVLASLGQSLLRQRRWPDAVALLEECHAKSPKDRDVAVALAEGWLEIGRWDDARTLLKSLLADPPGPQDADVLQILQNTAFLRGDPESQHWQDLLAEIDPARTVTGQVSAPAVEASREPLRARFRDGQLEISADFMDLPENERPVHMTAAIVAGSPDGLQLLSELEETDAAMAQRVMRLLGLVRLTAAEAEIHRHLAAGEEHFQHGRFEDAAHEYQQSVDLDPDQATALLYLGDTWYRRGSYELAQAYFEESLAAEPSPPAYRFLGDAILFSGGSRERTRGCYEEALRLDPSYGGAKVALQQLLDTEKEESSRTTWLGGQAAEPADLPTEDDPQAGAGADLPQSTRTGDRASASSASAVPSMLRWSDARSNCQDLWIKIV
jgi:tetratricopeptide (TPR) repeat protein